jgi:hypothetical protein
MPDRRNPEEAARWQEIRDWRQEGRERGYETLSPDERSLYPPEIAEAVAGLDALIDGMQGDPMVPQIAGMRKALDRLGASIAQRPLA